MITRGFQRIGVAYVLVLGAALVPARATQAEWTRETTDFLAEAFDAAATGNYAYAIVVRNLMLDPDVRSGEQHAFFNDYYQGRLLTEAQAGFWQALLVEETENVDGLAASAAIAASEALAQSLGETRVQLAGVNGAIVLLEVLAQGLDETRYGIVRTALSSAIEGSVTSIQPWITAREAQPRDPEAVRTGIQLALTLSQFALDGVPSAWLRVPTSARTFFERHEVGLFDDGSLDIVQLEALSSLFAAVPIEVHGVRCVLVPNGLGASSGDLGLISRGLILDVFGQSMDVLTNPDEFIEDVGPIAVPAFAADAAVQLMRAVQATQFAQRPELVARRDAVLSRSRGYVERYVRRIQTSAPFAQNPAEFLPQTAYLWFIDSPRAWNQALALLDLRQNEPIESLLLVADLLSGGGNESVQCRITPSGTVQYEAIPVQRTRLADGTSVVSGLGVGTQVWRFSFGPQGEINGVDVQ